MLLSLRPYSASNAPPYQQLQHFPFPHAELSPTDSCYNLASPPEFIPFYTPRSISRSPASRAETIMPVIENLKNFIRHGKQARQNDVQTPAQKSHAFTDPATTGLHQQQSKHDFSVNIADNKNTAAQATGAAANVQQQHQNIADGVPTGAIKIANNYDQETLAKIIAEEKANREKLPRYPGLDRWILTQKMGDGAFSNVYRARDSQGVYGEVAIKVVRKYELNASQRANILKEVSIMRRLDHPNIVKLIDFTEEKAYYYLILELCPGGELFHQIVRLTYFSEDLSRHVITQVAEALKYLHDEKGIVHRDIKPENLLFYPSQFIPTKNLKPKGPDDEDKVDEGEFIPGVGAGGIGQIKIADFGLSKIIWEDTTVTPCGTVGYTAPEIVKDERYSKSVDMWALGCVLYTLLCGFPPFYDESISVLTEKVARGQYTFLSPWWDDISKSAQDLVSHLLTVDPEKRYDINQFLAHPWIRGTTEPTKAANDAPPIATPAAFKEGLISLDESPGMPLETPGGTRRMDFRSPGAVSLREVFDVGYAVHRMEEENKRRKNWKQGYRGTATVPLNEEDEDEYEDSEDETSIKIPRNGESDNVASVEQKLRKTNLGGVASAGTQVPAGASAYSTHVAAARAPTAAQKKVVSSAAKTGGARKRAGHGFELSLDNATLLGRRKRGGEEAVAG